MGGHNSGRWGGRPTIEATASYVVSAKFLRRVASGCRGTSVMTWADGFRVSLSINTVQPTAAFLELRHAQRTGDESEVSYRVFLTRTAPRFGGSRWWFLCPRRQRRAFKLFLPLGGRQFWSRQAYGLGYACQRGTALDRAHRRAGKIKRLLSWDGDTPIRPPRMWRRTFARRMAQVEDADARIDTAWLPLALKILARHG
jgi:hypothetical protein